MNLFSNEVILGVSTYLSFSDVTALFHTCRRLRQFFQDEVLFKKLCLVHFPFAKPLKKYYFYWRTCYRDLYNISTMKITRSNGKNIDMLSIFRQPVLGSDQFNPYLPPRYYYMLLATRKCLTYSKIIKFVYYQVEDILDGFQNLEFFDFVVFGALYGKRYDILEWVNSTGYLSHIIKGIHEHSGDMLYILLHCLNAGQNYKDVVLGREEATSNELENDFIDIYEGKEFATVAGKEGLEWLYKKNLIDCFTYDHEIKNIIPL